MSADKIHYTYKHCTPENFKNDISFNEEEFTKELEKCFDTKVKVNKIDVEFIMEDGRSTNQFTCVIRISSPVVNHKIIEKSTDHHSRAVHGAIRKAVALVREEKDKITN